MQQNNKLPVYTDRFEELMASIKGKQPNTAWRLLYCVFYIWSQCVHQEPSEKMKYHEPRTIVKACKKLWESYYRRNKYTTKGTNSNEIIRPVVLRISLMIDWKKNKKKGHSYALNMELVWNQPMEILLPLLLGRNFNDMNPGQLGRIGLCKFTKQIHFTTEHYKETGFATYSTPHISQELHYWASTYTLNRKIV
jgi:hypothetical protein